MEAVNEVTMLEISSINYINVTIKHEGAEY